MAKEKAWLIRDSAEGIFSAGAAAVGKPFRRPIHQMQERLRTEAQKSLHPVLLRQDEIHGKEKGETEKRALFRRDAAFFIVQNA